MFWNHRVMQKTVDVGTRYEETFLYIVEVYYDDDTENIIGWTEKEEVWSDTVDGLRQSLHWMMDATEKPILIEADLLQRMEEITAMGGDAHEIGTSESGDIDLGREIERLSTREDFLESLGFDSEDYSIWLDLESDDTEELDWDSWEDDGGTPR